MVEEINRDDRWHQGSLVELIILDLDDQGNGVGRFNQQVVFVPDTVPGDRILARLLQVKAHYARGKLQELLEPSPHRTRPACIVADKCGGCQWQHITYEYQLVAKHNQVTQALSRLGEFANPPVLPVLGAASAIDYRNKSTYPIGLSKSAQAPKARSRSQAFSQESHPSQVIAGYYQKGSHRLINLNQCPIQDHRLNPLLADIKQDIQQQGWPIYDEQTHRGQVRHLSLRIGRRTGEQLLTLVVKDQQLPGIEEQSQIWLSRYPGLAGVLLNYNPDRTNAIFGSKTECILGQPYLLEEFADLKFQIQAETFFQVNTEQAERLLTEIITHLDLQGDEVLLDAYCGIGTFTLPLAQRVQRAVGLEIHAPSVDQARLNATLNGITNVSFQVGAVADQLPTLAEQPDIVLLDPPRKGCDRAVLELLGQLQAPRIVYVSCKPATLARDLKILCQESGYHLTKVQPIDFFPQTAHIESVAYLVRA